jgi:membrane-associated protein
MMEWLSQAIDYCLHLNKYLPDLVTFLGPWSYAILFLVIFCETGLVVTPFLPGDSLLFAAGAVIASPNPEYQLNLWAMLAVLIVAAVVGDAVNYAWGFYLGPKVFKYENSRIFNKKHLLRTQEFYEKYGAKAIILARFVPIVRTFAPFVAGIGKMGYRKFSLYNITGGIAWVALCLMSGYFFGGLPFVARNFELVIVAIILISVMPMVVEFILARRRRAAAAKPLVTEEV